MKLGLRSEALLVLLVTAGAAVSLPACSKEEENKPWRCNNADVPKGEVTRCTQLALGDVDTSWDIVMAGYASGPVPTDSVVSTGGTTSGGGTGSTSPTDPIVNTGISTTPDYIGWEAYVCSPSS